MPVWTKWFKTKKDVEKVDVLANTQAILEFLEECQQDIKALHHEFLKLEDLEKERQITKQHLVVANLEAQERVLDKLITRYEFFQNDVDINGLRLKKIAQQFLENARHAGMDELVRAKKKDSKWQFYW